MPIACTPGGSRRFFHRCLILAALVAFAGTESSVQAADPAPAGAIEYRADIEYGTGGDEKLLLDLALPQAVEGGGTRPALILIHGGGWAAGNRTNFSDLARQAARQGYVAATISYRLAPAHHFPAQIEDCKCAVRWMRAHADEYNIDPERIGALGGSAGAHLAMLLGTMDKEDGLEGEGGWSEHSSKVQAVVDFVGPTNLLAEYPDTSKEIVRNFIGGTKEEKQELYRQASPVTYVNAGDAPVLLLHGTKDELVPYEQPIMMLHAMEEAGVSGRVEIMLGERHGFSAGEFARTAKSAFEFLDLKLKNSK